MVLQDLYETEYDIFNHLNVNNNRPLSSVAFMHSEDINDGSLLEESMRNYTSKHIKDIFGLTYIEFLELPKDVIELMYKVADEEQTRKSNTLSELEQTFSNNK